MKFNSTFPLTFISLITLIALSASLLYPFDPKLISAKLESSSLNTGTRYYGHLQLWYYFASHGDWVTANKLALSLDPADTLVYRLAHDPQEIRKNINNLVVKPSKSADDWVELSRVQFILGKTDDAKASLTKAYTLDPIRSDISTLYYQLVK
ncbi:hypothetical protein KBC75_02670 [Candidatus Shapirobacteria bacterium]|nr:hypothetical protein [Candidatus Shapirobacteria bacterium]